MYAVSMLINYKMFVFNVTMYMHIAFSISTAGHQRIPLYNTARHMFAYKASDIETLNIATKGEYLKCQTRGSEIKPLDRMWDFSLVGMLWTI